MSNDEQRNSEASIMTESTATTTITRDSNLTNSSSSSAELCEQVADECAVSTEQDADSPNDEFIRITAAHKVLVEAQTYDQQNKYPLALRLYRICVNFLLEELIFAEGTEQSRIYLREKCAAIMDRIDLLKTKLEPIEPTVQLEHTDSGSPIDQ